MGVFLLHEAIFVNRPSSQSDISIYYMPFGRSFPTECAMSQEKTRDSEADPTTPGPASFMLTDPDGNPILVDQHV